MELTDIEVIPLSHAFPNGARPGRHAGATPQTITDRDELARPRERGYSLDDEENLGGIRCVAAPVRDGGDVLGAVSITGPSRRFTLDRLQNEFSEVVQEIANVIELNTKYS